MTSTYTYNGRKFRIITFPTKTHWWEDSDINLISTSETKLVDICNKYGFKNVLLPPPVCLNGRLS